MLVKTSINRAICDRFGMLAPLRVLSGRRLNHISWSTMALEKITPSVYRKDFPVVRMWRDDLEEISKLIEEVVGDSGSLIIQVYDGDDKYAVANVEDIATFKRSRVDSATLYAPSIGLTLILGPQAPTLEVEDPDLRVRGLIVEISRIVQTSARPLGRMNHWLSQHIWFVVFMFVLFISIGISGTLSFARYDGGEAEVSWTPAVLGLSMGMISYLIVKGLYRLIRLDRSILYVKTKIEEPTFWSRKKDDLAITVVSNVLSLGLGGIVGYWVNSIS